MNYRGYQYMETDCAMKNFHLNRRLINNESEADRFTDFWAVISVEILTSKLNSRRSLSLAHSSPMVFKSFVLR